MLLGSCPADGGSLIFTKEEKETFVQQYPELSYLLKPFIGSSEFIKNIERWCLWVSEKDLPLIRNNPILNKRVNDCKINRLNSKKKETQERAQTPYLFTENRYKKSNAIILPITSSERRKYIPIGFVLHDAVIYHSAFAIYDISSFIFGIITSYMHMVWMRAVAGRLKTDYRYSATLVYNTFPFPKISDQQKKRIELCVQEILRIREKYSEKTMAELYDPDKMPKDLLEAHHSLDLVIESCYRRKPFENDEQRFAHLLELGV